MLAWYSFDETGTDADRVDSHDPANTEPIKKGFGTLGYTTGKVGNALNRVTDGFGEYIYINRDEPNSNVFNFNNSDFSISCWIRSIPWKSTIA